jgi:hypothetical protein
MRVGTKAWAEAECGIHMYRPSVVGRKDPCPKCAEGDEANAQALAEQEANPPRRGRKPDAKQQPHVPTRAEHNHVRGGITPAAGGEN